MSGSLPPTAETVSPIRCNEKPWDLWVAEIGHASPLRDDEPPRGDPAKGPRRPDGSKRPDRPERPERHRHCGVTRLKRACMSLYGHFPSADLLNAALCHMCGMTVKCSAVHRHLLAHHSSAPLPILPPPPPAPTVKLKSSHKSKHKKDPPSIPLPPLPPLPLCLETDLTGPDGSGNVQPPLPPPATLPPLPPLPPLPAAVLQRDIDYFPEADGTQVKSAAQSEVKVLVDDNDLPVVSIRDDADLPLGDNLTDDIIAIMNSEGIRSMEELPETDPAAWKNLIRDISAIREMSLPENVSAHDLYNVSGTVGRVAGASYSLGAEEGPTQYVRPVTLSPVIDVDPSGVVFPVRTAPVKPRPGKASKSSKPKYTVREYDPNKHCGVLSSETQKPCTRSLTCKSHALSLRRQVDGRVKSFDLLLAEHRAAKQPPIMNLVPVLSDQNDTIATISIPSPPLLVPDTVDISDFTGLDTRHEVTSYYSSILSSVEGVAEETELVSLLPQEVAECLADTPVPVEVPVPAVAVRAVLPAPPEPPRLPEPRPGDVCWYPSSPRPLAACTFSACHMGNALLLGKRLATVRRDIKAALARPRSESVVNNYFSFNQNSITSKSAHANGATKSTTPEVRKLIMACPVSSGPGVKSERGVYYDPGGRQNGHSFSSKRPLLDEYEEAESKCARGGQGVRSKVTKRMSQADLMELNCMYDPMMADEKC